MLFSLEFSFKNYKQLMEIDECVVKIHLEGSLSQIFLFRL